MVRSFLNVLLGRRKLTFSISREFTPGFRDLKNLLTLRLTWRVASQRVALGGVSLVFFNLAHGGNVKHSNPVLVEGQRIGRAVWVLPTTGASLLGCVTRWQAFRASPTERDREAIWLRLKSAKRDPDLVGAGRGGRGAAWHSTLASCLLVQKMSVALQVLGNPQPSFPGNRLSALGNS